MIEKIYQYIKEKNMLENCRHIIVGLSGGADSVCLLAVLHTIIMQYHMDMDITAVHVNHEIRGSEALRDQCFVQKLSKDFGVACYVCDKDVKAIAKKRGVSLETAGRQVRYECFRQIKNELGFSNETTKIAVAHHIDDLVETSLMHLIRGSGIEGFAGIQPVNQEIIRPLLCVRKKEILQFLKTQDIKYVVDSTNLQSDYQRNQLRNQLIPYIEKKYNPEFANAVYYIATDLSEINCYINRQITELEKACIRYENANQGIVAHLWIDEFEKADKTLQSYLLRTLLKKVADSPADIYRKHIELLGQLCQKQVGKQLNLSNGIIAVRGYHDIILQKGVVSKKNLCQQQIDSFANHFSVSIDLCELKMGKKQCIPLDIDICDMSGTWYKAKNIYLQLINKNEINKNYSNNVYTKFFDCDKISRKIDIRFKKASDFIQVHADGSKKKLKKEFIDKKIPSNVRGHILLAACEHEVLWAVGVRRCQTALVDENTKRILKMCVVVEEKSQINHCRGDKNG